MKKLKNIEIVSLNISKEKGTVKKPVDTVITNEKGIIGDAHSGTWHRQVSMLASESIEKFKPLLPNGDINYGDFAENITTRGIDLTNVNLFDRFKIGDVVLEVTQIGKKCHGTGCEIYQQVGKCVMPQEGIFTRVLSGGKIDCHSKIEYLPEKIKINVLTLSDRASKGIYEDLSGPEIIKLLKEHAEQKHYHFDIKKIIIGDEPQTLKDKVNNAVHSDVEIIFTTGGTGIGPKDITPDVLVPMFDKEIPGIMEYVRQTYGTKKPAALISRSAAGIIDSTMVFAMPGSVKAVKEYMTEILKVLDHMFFMVRNIDNH